MYAYVANRPGPDPSFTDEEIIRVIVAARPPPLGTTDIADRLGVSRQAITRHLKRLHKTGLLNKEKVSGTNLWWPTDAGRALLVDNQGSLSESDQ
jgi:DNA-binding MarR family transcriptional regulator